MVELFENIVFSKSVESFKTPILTMHPHLRDNYNCNAPIILFGLYRNEDLRLVLQHKSYCMIIFGGSDTFIGDKIWASCGVNRFNNLLKLKEHMNKNNKIILISQSKWISDDLKKINLDHHLVPWYSLNKNLFSPVNKGKFIYIYNKDHPFYGASLIKNIEKKLQGKYYIITANGSISYEKMPEIYSQCFIGLRLVLHDGLASTVQELGLMGIKCVHNGNSPSALNYKTENDIIAHIEREAQKIGTIDEKMANQVDKYLNIDSSFFKINTWFN